MTNVYVAHGGVSNCRIHRIWDGSLVPDRIHRSHTLAIIVSSKSTGSAIYRYTIRTALQCLQCR